MEPSPAAPGPARRPPPDLLLALGLGLLATLPFWVSSLARATGLRPAGLSIPITLAWEATVLAAVAPLAARPWARRPGRVVLWSGTVPAAWHLAFLASSLWTNMDSPPGSEDHMGLDTALILFALFGSLLVAIPMGLAALGAALASRRGSSRAAGWVLMAAALPILLVGRMLVPARGLWLPVLAAIGLAVSGAVVALRAPRKPPEETKPAG